MISDILGSAYSLLGISIMNYMSILKFPLVFIFLIIFSGCISSNNWHKVGIKDGPITKIHNATISSNETIEIKYDVSYFDGDHIEIENEDFSTSTSYNLSAFCKSKFIDADIMMDGDDLKNIAFYQCDFDNINAEKPEIYDLNTNMELSKKIKQIKIVNLWEEKKKFISRINSGNCGQSPTIYFYTYPHYVAKNSILYVAYNKEKDVCDIYQIPQLNYDKSNNIEALIKRPLYLMADIITLPIQGLFLAWFTVYAF